MDTIRFFFDNKRMLGLGLLLSSSASFGQTYYIAVFGGEMRLAFGLTDGALGTLYGMATLLSAACIIPTGPLMDRVRLLPMAVATALGLALGCLVLAGAWHIMALGLGYFLVRFFGQGLMSQLSITAMARRFDKERGRAISIATLGFQLGLGLFPPLGLALIGWFGWRGAWLASAALLVLITAPLIWLLLGQTRRKQGPADLPADYGRLPSDWSRAQVLRDPRFYAVMPTILAAPFIQTAVIFHQTRLVAEKGWTLEGFVTGFIFYAIIAVLTSLAGGAVVDRIGARRLVAFAALPMALGLGLLCYSNALAAGWAFLILSGMTGGILAVVIGSLWAELYGVGNLGAIKSLSGASMILASALGPPLVGMLLDLGVGMTRQSLFFAIYILLGAALCFIFGPSRHRVRPDRS